MSNRVAFIIVTLAIVGCTPIKEVQENVAPSKTFNVMAPLHIKVFNDPKLLEESDWVTFRNQLKLSKDMGISAVSVDVWWGDVEAENDNVFNWGYYRSVFKEITDQGLDIIPILSFHQCGGNVGDNYTSLLPQWIWPKLVDENQKIASDIDLKYVSNATDENGDLKFSNEYVALWADEFVLSQYVELMQAFKNEFQNYRDQIQEINISCGPSGELRYPSYNSHDNWSYPGSGHLQCYSNLALKDFSKSMEKRYATLAIMNEAWSTNYNSFDEVSFPENGDEFFESGEYYSTPFGQDFVDWYNQSMVDHGIRMMQAAADVFETTDSTGIALGFKIPGIHWQMQNPNSPRASEIKCGLINAKNLSGARGYYETLSEIFEALPNDKVNLHFTCLEMGNEYSGEGVSDHYSRAQDLVFQVDSVARALKIRVKGENALSGNLYSDFGWDRLEEALTKGSYEGITILRMGDVTTDNELGNLRYEKIIKEY